VTLDDLRRAAVARTLFTPATLQGALDRLGFVQADPIRAPARAQDLTLRHRVVDYCAGDLERRYAELDVHEDVFVNYGFVTGRVQALMHPRRGPAPWKRGHGRRVRALLEFVRTRGPVHPRDVDRHFSHGTVTNYWGGSSNATTHLLYSGLLRVVGRDAGIRIYAVREHGASPNDAVTRRAQLDALVDVIVGIYGPLPPRSLSALVARLQYAVPQWTGELTSTLQRAKRRLAHHRVDGVDWYSPAGEAVVDGPDDRVRLLAPFDPIVWDRRRFELLWGWAYRFEAYIPAVKRKHGYYALPLLWRDRVVGWGNVSQRGNMLTSAVGYIASHPPRDRSFRRALEDELHRLRRFLGLESATPRAATHSAC